MIHKQAAKLPTKGLGIPGCTGNVIEMVGMGIQQQAGDSQRVVTATRLLLFWAQVALHNDQTPPSQTPTFGIRFAAIAAKIPPVGLLGLRLRNTLFFSPKKSRFVPWMLLVAHRL